MKSEIFLLFCVKNVDKLAIPKNGAVMKMSEGYMQYFLLLLNLPTP